MPEIEDNDPAKAEDTPTGQEKYSNTFMFVFLMLFVFHVNAMCLFHNEHKVLKSVYASKVQLEYKM